jgi:hypothetical protein
MHQLRRSHRGEALFGIDVQVPDMVYASYVKCPHIGGRPVSANLDEIKAQRGVIDAFIIEGQAGPYRFDIRNSTQVSPGVAIVARDTWATMRARKLLKVQWDTKPASSDDSEQITEAAKAVAGRRDEAKTISSAGDASQALLDAKSRAKALLQRGLCVSRSARAAKLCGAGDGAVSRNLDVQSDPLGGRPAFTGSALTPGRGCDNPLGSRWWRFWAPAV